jgi:two-component system phosphate regulon sensor histidine kinase PhoR
VFLVAVQSFFFFDLSLLNLIQLSGISFLGIFIFSYFLLSYRFENFMINRVRELYNSLFPSTTSTSIIKSAEDIDLLTTNLKKLNTDKNLEIEVLKNQENYRKEFIGNIAHELKTPLFTIQGYILTLLDGEITDQKIIKKYLRQTSKGVDRLSYVVKDLDLITKFESGIATLEIKPFDILTTLQNVFELLEMQAKKNKITLKLNKKYETPIWVQADEERIQQVLTNLVMNSLKYGVERGITEVAIEPLEQHKILVRISDNGEGIDKKHLPRLFERFYRVEKTRNRKLGGSGLGLSIVKHIMDAHQEKIFVESEANVGSEFSFTLTRAPKSTVKAV